MKTAETFSIDFIIRRSKTAPSTAMVFGRVCVNGQRKEISLKESIPYTTWDSSKEMMKGSSEQVKSLNKFILNVRNKLTNVYRNLKDDNALVTAQSIKDYYLQQGEYAPRRNTLLTLVDYHNKINDGLLAKGTLKNYHTTKGYIQKFIESKYNKTDYFLDDLDISFITEFEYYIRTTPLKKHDPCHINGIAKHIERLKKILNWGKSLKWIKDKPFEDFKVIKKRTKREKLSLSEVKKIASKTFNKPILKLTQDLFIFSCFTGLSYIDVLNLKTDDLEEGIDGNLWCKIYRKKTDELAAIPLLEQAKLLIQKYLADSGKLNHERIFPSITNQELNRNLKIIAEICEISKPLHFHIARHTFATTITLKMGVPMETVSKMLGHTKLSTTKIYANVDEEKISMDMEKASLILKNNFAN